ncbi:alpha/beta hydrolase family esterase [Streptomyces sp. NPDC002730]|uniref:alpha/beta hydrolase family esterase n=1 Tax=Streptomyces sp. NPDC002730 TaxID=3364662 RepID=UPI00367D9011
MNPTRTNGHQQETVQVGGATRTFTLVRPGSPTEQAPVVLVFHGSKQDAAKFRVFTAGTFDRWAQEAGAIVAYLDGYKGHWNDARVSTSFAARTDGVDDVAFARATLDLLVRRYNGDGSAVYVVGFSNGGQMVIRLVHEMPAVLAGAAILSATQPVPENFAPNAAQNQPLPVLLIHGTKDPLVPYAGGMASMWGFRPRGLGLSAQETAAYYASRNGITTAPTTTPVEAAEAGRTKVERTDYREQGHQPVTLYTVHGGGHTIPGPKRAPRILGRTAQNFRAADLISDFFGLTSRVSG